MIGHISFSVSKNCYNHYESYGMICVGCGCCSSDKKKRLTARIELHMTDQEKLINLIMQRFDWQIAPETENKIIINANLGELVDALIAHGVTVREPQKPLTVEEAREMPDVVWVEWSFGGCEPRIPSTIDIDAIHNIEHYSFTDEITERLDDYGKTWRCWAEKPTEAERKAAEWLK